MEKGKFGAVGGGMLPLWGQFSGFSYGWSGSGVKGESSNSAPPTAMPRSDQVCQLFLFGSRQVNPDLSRMLDFPTRNVGHRRVQSENLGMPPNKVGFSSNLSDASNGPGLSEENENEEDIISVYLDMEKLSSTFGWPGLEGGEESRVATPQAPSPKENMSASPNEEKPMLRHKQSLSFDGFTMVKPEPLILDGERTPELVTKRAMSAAKLAELALLDPKRAKRIWANRQSAARSKERKVRYIVELETRVQNLQTEATTLSVQLSMLQRDTADLTAENNELKLRLHSLEQQVQLQDVLNDALREEVQGLKVATGVVSPTGGHMANFGAAFGTGQQFYPYNNALRTLITAQQLQQLQICSPQLPHEQQNQAQQQPAPNGVKNEGPSSPNHKEPDVVNIFKKERSSIPGQ